MQANGKEVQLIVPGEEPGKLQVILPDGVKSGDKFWLQMPATSTCDDDSCEEKSCTAKNYASKYLAPVTVNRLLHAARVPPRSSP